MNRQEILEAAAKCVNGDRDEQYGNPENSFSRIARLWNAYLFSRKETYEKVHYDPVTQGPITAQDVAQMMILFKIARIKREKYHVDNWIDISGYAACGGEIEEMLREERDARLRDCD